MKLLNQWRKKHKSSLCGLIDPVNIILSHEIRELQNLSKEITLTWSHVVVLSYTNDSIKYFSGRKIQQKQQQQ